MAKLKLYYVTSPAFSAGYEPKEGFFVAEKKKQAEKAGRNEWSADGKAPVTATRVRLKEKGWLKHFKSA